MARRFASCQSARLRLRVSSHGLSKAPLERELVIATVSGSTTKLSHRIWWDWDMSLSPSRRNASDPPEDKRHDWKGPRSRSGRRRCRRSSAGNLRHRCNDRTISMPCMRFDRGGRFVASVCGAHGSSSNVRQLRWHCHAGGPYTAWPLASNAGCTLSEISVISESSMKRHSRPILIRLEASSVTGVFWALA